MPFEWQVEEFMCYCQSKQLREKTMKSYEQTIKLFVKWVRDSQKIESVEVIKEQTIRRYIVDLQERGKYTYYANDSSKLLNCPDRRRDFRNEVSNTTVNNYIRNLKVFFNWLYEQGTIKKNPMEKIKQLPNKHKPKDFITDEEFHRLISIFNKSYLTDFRDYMIINLLMDTGMRIGECLSLTTENINLNSRTIFLSERITKGRKDRTVFFSQKTSQELKQWFKFKDRYCESIVTVKQ